MSEFENLRKTISHHEAYGDPGLAPAIEEIRELLDCRDALAADLSEMEEAWREGDAFEKAVSDPAKQAHLEMRIDEIDDDIRRLAVNLFGY